MNKFMMQQAKKLQEQMLKAQGDLANQTVEARSGGGAVTVVMNGQQQIQSISISPGVINPDKADQLEQLVMKAVTEAIAKSQKLASKQLKGLTGGMKIPGLF